MIPPESVAGSFLAIAGNSEAVGVPHCSQNIASASKV